MKITVYVLYENSIQYWNSCEEEEILDKSEDVSSSDNAETTVFE